MLDSDAIERVSNNSSEATLPPSYRRQNRAAAVHHQRYSGSHLLTGGRLMYSHSNRSHNNYTLGMYSPPPESVPSSSTSLSHQRQRQPALTRSSSFEHLTTSVSEPLVTVPPLSLPPQIITNNTADQDDDVNSVNTTTSDNVKQQINRNKQNKKDLVTIVTISGCVDEASAPIVDNKNEEGELLAHL